MNRKFTHSVLYSSLLALAITGCSSDQSRHEHAEAKAKTTEVEQPSAQNKKAELHDLVLAEEVSATQPSPVQPSPADLTKSRQLMAADASIAGAAKMSARSYAAHAPVQSLYQPQPERQWHQTQIDRENYIAEDENAIKRVSEDPLSTFSVDVDTAAYSNVRRMIIREGRLPPSAAVKAEEFINYFNYDYQSSHNLDAPFAVNTEIAASPWNDNKHLLQIGLQGFEPELAERPAANLVFLIDVSGSMNNPQKLGLVKKSLRLLVNQMRAEDRIALTVYAGAAGTVLESTGGDEKAKILSALDNLQAGGSTHGSAGIQLAYQVAEQHFIKDGINRVIIASDGDMNVGTVNHDALKDLIKSKRDKGIALTTLGYGSGNYNYALMEQMADVGNGNAAYIDSLREAQKVLVNEMQSTLLTIAKDVKIQIEFNPDQVSEYRLIGYQNRLLKREDFSNDKVDAGDIGAGHTVTALYEVTLKSSGGEQLPKLRYQSTKTEKSAKAISSDSNELAYVRLRYKQPQGKVSREISQAILRSDVQQDFNLASDDLRFASSVAAFAQKLRSGVYINDINYSDIASAARQSKGQDSHGYRAEFIALVELAAQLQPGQAQITPASRPQLLSHTR